MRITHVITGMDPAGGGPPVALEGLAAAQHRLGAEVRIAATFRQGDHDARVERLRDQGIDMRMIGPTSGPLQLAKGMKAKVDDAIADADIVHIHNLWEQVQHVAASTARRRRVPYVVRPCGMLDPWSLAQSKVRKRLMLALRTRRMLNGAAALHYTADAEAELAAPLGLKPPALVVANGVDFSPFTQTPRDPDFYDKRFPSFAGRPRIVFLSRLHPKKGADILLDAFARLLEQRTASGQPRPALVMVGPDENATQSDLEAQARKLGIADDVVFAGLLVGEDKVHVLREADVFALPSHQENFGIAVVEALAAGTPVVISDQVNIHEPITRANLGEALPLDDRRVEAFAEELDRWLEDEAERTRVADAAPGWVAQQYSWDTLAEQWVNTHYPALTR
ncbi:MAG: glycosyltransferase [Planctomycetota bacterium]